MLAERFFSSRDEARRLEAGCCAVASRFVSGLGLGFDSGFISILDFGLAILDCYSQNLQGFRRLNL